MPKKTFTPEEIISKLREAEVLLGQGQPIGAVCRGLGRVDCRRQRGRAALRRASHPPSSGPRLAPRFGFAQVAQHQEYDDQADRSHPSDKA